MCADPRPQAAAAPWVRRRAAFPMASRTRGSKQPRTEGVSHVWHRRAPRAGVQGVRWARCGRRSRRRRQASGHRVGSTLVALFLADNWCPPGDAGAWGARGSTTIEETTGCAPCAGRTRGGPSRLALSKGRRLQVRSRWPCRSPGRPPSPPPHFPTWTIPHRCDRR